MWLANRNNVILCCVLVLLSLPSLLYAMDCRQLLAQLPNHSRDDTPFSLQVKSYEENCRARENGSDPAVYNACISAGMSALGIGGNFIAAETLAKLYCEVGQPKLSKQWMRSIINNPDAPALDKDIAIKFVELVED